MGLLHQQTNPPLRIQPQHDSNVCCNLHSEAFPWQTKDNFSVNQKGTKKVVQRGRRVCMCAHIHMRIWKHKGKNGQSHAP